MRIILPIIFIALTLSTSTFALTPDEVEIGSQLREATLQGLNVSTGKFSNFRGKPLLINVWASWCGPCRAEIGSLERLARRYNGKEFNVIGISIDDYSSAAKDFIKQSKITFANFLDSKLFLEHMLGANTIPLTVLVDDQGRVLLKARGAFEWDSPEVIAAIEQTFRLNLTQENFSRPSKTSRCLLY